MVLLLLLLLMQTKEHSHHLTFAFSSAIRRFCKHSTIGQYYNKIQSTILSSGKRLVQVELEATKSNLLIWPHTYANGFNVKIIITWRISWYMKQFPSIFSNCLLLIFVGSAHLCISFSDLFSHAFLCAQGNKTQSLNSVYTKMVYAWQWLEKYM